MKIVFFSNFINHHQVLVSDRLYNLTNQSYVFVETTPIPDSFVKSGYPTFEKPYLLKAWESAEKLDIAHKLAKEADVAIFSSMCFKSFAIERLKSKKLTFEMSERWLKRGIINLFSPNLWKHQFTYYKYARNAPSYMLCCSAFAANDYYLLKSYKDRCFKWGYFTQVDENANYDSFANNDSEKVRIMWCARFLKWKHPELVVKMAATLKDKGYRFVVDMYGGEGNSAKYDKVFPQKRLESMIEKYGVQDIVKLKGVCPNLEILSAMQSHNIFLFTSDRNEGWGAVANEAMANGCAIVASKSIGSSPYLIENGKNGFMFDDCDVNSLCEKVEWLIKHPQEMKIMQRNAYLQMKNMWNPNVAANNLIRLINDLQNGRDSSIQEGPCSKAIPQE